MTMSHLLHSFLIIVIGLAALPAAQASPPIDPYNPAIGRFSDEWVEVYMGDNKVGYGHTTMSREGDHIHTGSTFKLRLGRVDQPIKIEIEQETTETLAGIPLSFGSKTHAAMMQTTMNGRIHDGRVTMVTSQYGMQQEQSFDFPTGALMVWGAYRESMLRGFTPGTEYVLMVYAPDLRLDGAVSAKTSVGTVETFTHGGETKRGQRVTVVLKSPIGSMEMISWVDESGRPLKATLPLPGFGDMTLITTDQATAMKSFVAPEIFMTSIVKVDRRIDRKSAGKVTYRIFRRKGINADVDLETLPDTGLQRVRKRGDGSVEVIVERQRHGSEISTTSKIDAVAMREFLASNLMINTADPKLIALARKAAGERCGSAYTLADRLRRFVSDYVESKTLNVGFATASEVCRTREGDCSEHGVLLAALGRINGLPSRVVVGLAYMQNFGGQENIFGYHLWTQFFIDGKWVDFDAALNESECSPTRIAFATSSLQNAGLADLSLPLLSRIGAIEIEVESIEPISPPTD